MEGRAGDLIDELIIKTNKGKTHKFGGSGGNHFSIECGKKVVAFYGGVGGHLHNIGVYYKH